MDLNAEFYKETGKRADDGYRYNDYYVEWLEERCEFYDRFISQLNK